MMNSGKIMQILNDLAFIRTGGTEQELSAAKYIQNECAEMGLKADIVPFEVDMAAMQEATLTVDGQNIACKGYLNAGCAAVEAPLYYLRSTDAYSLSQCKGKIVMIDGYLGYWIYQDILSNGAVGFITYSSSVNYADEDIDQRELRSFVSNGNKIPGVNINVKAAVELIRSGAKTAKIILQQEEYKGNSHNVVLEMPGQVDEYITLTAHYDSTWLSQGVYDNMSGSVGILGVAEYFITHPHRYGLRFVWCGSEERGLLGSKAYCNANEDELKSTVLNINLDMIGCIMGKFIACCSAEKDLVSYIGYLGNECGFPVKAYQDVYSSDSTPFADHGVPALSFARIAPHNTATIHDRYDTIALMRGEQMQQDIDFITAFTDRMANSQRCPVKREIPQEVKEKLDYYLMRKRRPE